MISSKRDQEELLQKSIEAGARPELPSELNCRLKDLIKQCWDSIPENRPTFEDICSELKRIRSSQPEVTTVPSGVSILTFLCSTLKTLTSVATLPRLGVMQGHEESNGTCKSTTWGDINIQNCDADSANPMDIHVPEYLRIDPKSLEKDERIASPRGENPVPVKIHKATYLGCTFAV